MTINGKHTIAEIRDLDATIEFRIKAADDLIAKVNFAPGAFLTPGQPFVSAATINQWNAWQKQWRAAADPALSLCTALSLSNPLVPASVQTAEDQWMKLMKALPADSQAVLVFAPGSFKFILEQIQKEAGQPIDESKHPLPTATDPDLAALSKLDAAIKAGEAAAKAAGDGTKQAAFKVPWYVWAGGTVIVGGVATAYLAPLANLLPVRRRR